MDDRAQADDAGGAGAGVLGGDPVDLSDTGPRPHASTAARGAAAFLLGLACLVAAPDGRTRVAPFVAHAQPAPTLEAWHLVATHPDAAKQRTATGKTLRGLLAWQGAVWAGYGDYGANTGPIRVAAFDPASGAFVPHHLSDTEAIENYRVLPDLDADGTILREQLWAPAIDPRKDADIAVGPPWEDRKPIGMTHAYDIATLDGRDGWLAGSKGNDAVVYRAADRDGAWQRSLAVGPISGLKDDFARFYFIGSLEGRLYVQATDYSGGLHPRSRIWDGTAWLDGPNLLPGFGMGWRPVAFGGELVYIGGEYGGPLMRFDGRVARQMIGATPSTGPFAVAADVVDGPLYALVRLREPSCPTAGCPIVLRTADLAVWQRLSPAAPEGSTAMAVLGGVPYVGATEARLFRLDSPPAWSSFEPTWNALPTVRFTAPADRAAYDRGAPIAFGAEAGDADGEVGLRVQFWAGTIKLAEHTARPFGVTWTDAPTGTHRIVVRAIDAAGAMAVDRVTVVVRDTWAATATAAPTTIAPTPPPPATPLARTRVWLPVALDRPSR